MDGDYEGSMMFCYKEEWINVCGENIGDSVAEVVCRQLELSMHSKCVERYEELLCRSFTRLKL